VWWTRIGYLNRKTLSLLMLRIPLIWFSSPLTALMYFLPKVLCSWVSRFLTFLEGTWRIGTPLVTYHAYVEKWKMRDLKNWNQDKTLSSLTLFTRIKLCNSIKRIKYCRLSIFNFQNVRVSLLFKSSTIIDFFEVRIKSHLSKICLRRSGWDRSSLFSPVLICF